MNIYVPMQFMCSKRYDSIFLALAPSSGKTRGFKSLGIPRIRYTRYNLWISSRIQPFYVRIRFTSVLLKGVSGNFVSITLNFREFRFSRYVMATNTINPYCQILENISENRVVTQRVSLKNFQLNFMTTY